MPTVSLTIDQAQDVLNALRSGEDTVARYEAHLRRVAAVSERSGAPEAQQQVLLVAAVGDLLTDAVVVLQDALASWLLIERQQPAAQGTLLQADEPPF